MAQIYLIDQKTFKDYEDISINVKPERIKVFVKKAQELDLKPFLGHAFYYDFIKHALYSGFETATIITPATTANNGNYVNQQIEALSGNGKSAFASFVVANGQVVSVIKTDPGNGFAIGDSFTSSAVPGAVFQVATLNEDVVFDDDTPQAYLDFFNGVSYNDKNGNEIIYEGLIPMLVYFTFSRFIEADAIHYTASGPVVKTRDNSEPLKPSEITKIVQQQRSVANAHANEVEKFLFDNRANFPLWKYNEKNRSARQSGPRIRGIDTTDFNYPGGSYSNTGYIPINDLLS